MSKVKIEYNKLPYQDEFHEATEHYDILSAGYGAGKTYSLCMKALRLGTMNFGLPAGILCPDLKMFKRDVLPTFEEIAERNRFKIKFRQSFSELLIYPSKTKCLVFHAEDEGRSIRGPNLAWGIANEVTLVSKKAFDAFLALHVNHVAFLARYFVHVLRRVDYSCVVSRSQRQLLKWRVFFCAEFQ